MYEFRYRRFKDPPGTWNVFTKGSLTDCLEDFFDYKSKGIGRRDIQDDKGWAEIDIRYGGDDD